MKKNLLGHRWLSKAVKCHEKLELFWNRWLTSCIRVRSLCLTSPSVSAMWSSHSFFFSSIDSCTPLTISLAAPITEAAITLGVAHFVGISDFQSNSSFSALCFTFSAISWTCRETLLMSDAPRATHSRPIDIASMRIMRKTEEVKKVVKSDLSSSPNVFISCENSDWWGTTKH